VQFCKEEQTKGELPLIKGLFDWYRQEQPQPNDLIVEQMIDGAWYWRYPAGRLCYKDTQTMVAIKCMPPETFSGVLRFTVTFSEAPRKIIDMPFTVEN
jgi:hypothetical protein